MAYLIGSRGEIIVIKLISTEILLVTDILNYIFPVTVIVSLLLLLLQHVARLIQPAIVSLQQHYKLLLSKQSMKSLFYVSLQAYRSSKQLFWLAQQLFSSCKQLL